MAKRVIEAKVLRLIAAWERNFAQLKAQNACEFNPQLSSDEVYLQALAHGHQDRLNICIGQLKRLLPAKD